MAAYAQRFPDRVVHRSMLSNDRTGGSAGESLVVCKRTAFNGIEHLETVELPLILDGGHVLVSFEDWLEHQLHEAGAVPQVSPEKRN